MKNVVCNIKKVEINVKISVDGVKKKALFYQESVEIKARSKTKLKICYIINANNCQNMGNRRLKLHTYEFQDIYQKYRCSREDESFILPRKY